jgi:hypothetical protein
MTKIIVIFTFLLLSLSAQHLLVPMDKSQSDHLKAYGLAWQVIRDGDNVEWLLNYRSGSFLLPDNDRNRRLAALRGIGYTTASTADLGAIYQEIETNNMDRVMLEKAPKIAVYSPDSKQPWDDAVTMVLEYAEIPYDKVYDPQVMAGELSQYDWLHLHHEDFTGQMGKFYGNYRNAMWYIKNQSDLQQMAEKLGFATIPQLKSAVAENILQYIQNGGFLFAMCSATDALDITIAAAGADIVDVPFDGTPPARNYNELLKFERTLAFENFKLITNPTVYEYSDIDTPPSNQPRLRGAEADYFTLFEFSAKWDPVPTMLTQCHTNAVRGFMGQTTMFRKDKIKSDVIIMGEIVDADQVKYIHGKRGKGMFTYYGGHDPEDYTHAVGDPHTQLDLHKQSPGYRLILNNILFPAAKKKKRKT